MLGLFKRDKEKIVLIKAPVKGKVMDLREVPDPVFAQGMLGDGVAFEPLEGKVMAPVDAEVIQVMDTKHAVGLKTKEGVEVLIHIGIDTVELKGEGFEVHVSPGNRVKTGDLLISFDLETIRTRARSMITPMVITNMERVSSLEKSLKEDGEWVLKATVNK